MFCLQFILSCGCPVTNYEEFLKHIDNGIYKHEDNNGSAKYNNDNYWDYYGNDCASALIFAWKQIVGDVGWIGNCDTLKKGLNGNASSYPIKDFIGDKRTRILYPGDALVGNGHTILITWVSLDGKTIKYSDQHGLGRVLPKKSWTQEETFTSWYINREVEFTSDKVDTTTYTHVVRLKKIEENMPNVKNMAMQSEGGILMQSADIELFNDIENVNVQNDFERAIVRSYNEDGENIDNEFIWNVLEQNNIYVPHSTAYISIDTVPKNSNFSQIIAYNNNSYYSGELIVTTEDVEKFSIEAIYDIEQIHNYYSFDIIKEAPRTETSIIALYNLDITEKGDSNEEGLINIEGLINGNNITLHIVDTATTISLGIDTNNPYAKIELYNGEMPIISFEDIPIVESDNFLNAIIIAEDGSEKSYIINLVRKSLDEIVIADPKENKYSKYFKDGAVSDYTIIEDNDSNSYIVGGINVGDIIEDLMNNLANGVNVYKDNALVTLGKIGTGMTIRHEADDSEITIVIKGDVTGNGSPGLRDLRSFMNYTMNGAEYNEAQKLAVADFIDEKGKGIEAVKELLEYIVGNR